jgi:uncharacterized protein YqjF (DUF2071 family)
MSIGAGKSRRLVFQPGCGEPVAVAIARSIWKLPYFIAAMNVRKDAGYGSITYSTKRQLPPPLPASSEFHWTPTGTPFHAEPGTLEHFLAERYILYAYAYGRLWRGKVHHAPYPLQTADLDPATFSDTSIAAAGITLPAESAAHPPLIHYASGVDVDVFPLRSLA